MALDKKWFLNMLPAVLAAIALIFSAASSFSCYTFSTQGSPTTRNDENNSTIITHNVNVEFGLWTYKSTYYAATIVTPNEATPSSSSMYTPMGNLWTDDNAGFNNRQSPFLVQQSSCVGFSSANSDAYWRTARVCSVFVVILGAFLTFSVTLASCNAWTISAQRWRIIGITTLFLLPLLQGLTFLAFKSSVCKRNDGSNNSPFGDCEWNQGSGGNVVGILFWIFLGICMLVFPPPSRPAPKPAATQAVTYQQTVDADGNPIVVESQVIHGSAKELDA